MYYPNSVKVWRLVSAKPFSESLLHGRVLYLHIILERNRIEGGKKGSAFNRCLDTCRPHKRTRLIHFYDRVHSSTRLVNSHLYIDFYSADSVQMSPHNRKASIYDRLGVFLNCLYFNGLNGWKASWSIVYAGPNDAKDDRNKRRN